MHSVSPATGPRPVGLVIRVFFNSIVMSILSYAISSWFNGCSDSLKKDLNRFRKRVCKMIPAEYHSCVQSNQEIFNSKCISLCEKILTDLKHPLHTYVKKLPHHDNLLSMIYCRTSRFKSTFVPSAIKVYNLFEK